MPEVGSTRRSGSTPETAPGGPLALRGRGALAFDLGLSVVLAVVAFSMRRDGLPTDGLWFDDSWVAAGATFATPTNLMTTGSGHPGFTALLAVIHRLGGGFTAMAVPALIAGCLGPVAIYWLLRRLGQARAVALLLAAVVVVAPTHVLYSGRVKSYTFDLLWISLLTALVVRLANVQWTWRIAAGWLLLVAVGTSSSGYVLVGSAIAIVFLLVHAGTDRWVRLAVTAVQGVGQLAYFLVARSKADLDGIEEVMESSYDAHMTFQANPVAFVEETLKHLHRVGEVYPSGPDALVTAAVVVSLVGLALGAIGGLGRLNRLGLDPRIILAARYLAALVGFAFVGAMVDRFPFGPTNEMLLSHGGRHTIWLMPAVAVGLAVVAGVLWRLVADRADTARLAANALLVGAAAVILVHGHREPVVYPQSGSQPLAEFVDETMGPNDVVVVTLQSTFLFMLSTSSYVALESTPDHQVGFAPAYPGRRIHSVGYWGTEPMTREHLERITEGADRILVIGGGWVGYDHVDQANAVAEARGYEVTVHEFGTESVWLWERPDPGGAPATGTDDTPGGQTP